jgi:hypothetical protein
MLDEDWDDLPPGEQNDLKEEDRRVLREVRLRRFSATPESVPPFVEAILRWQVTGPSEGVFTITLDGGPVDLVGSRAVRAFGTKTYRLTAWGHVLTKELGQVTVSLNNQECEEGPVPASAVTNRFETLAAAQFSRGQFSMRDGARSEMDSEGVSINIPAKVDIRGWFDADLDLDLAFQLFVGHTTNESRVQARLRTVDIDISFNFAEHLASLGCSSAMQGALEKLFESVVRSIVGPGLETQIAQGLQSAADGWLATWQDADDQGRPYRLLALETNSTTLLFIGCPIGDSAPPLRPRRLIPQFEDALLRQ